MASLVSGGSSVRRSSSTVTRVWIQFDTLQCCSHLSMADKSASRVNSVWTLLLSNFCHLLLLRKLPSKCIYPTRRHPSCNLLSWFIAFGFLESY